MPLEMHAAGSGLAQFARSWLASIERTFRPHLPLYAVALAFCAATLLLASAHGIPLSYQPSLVFLGAIPLFLLVIGSILALLHLLHLVRTEKPASPLKAMGGWIGETLTQGDRPGNISHALIIFLPLMITFTALKEAIPVLNPFSWDSTFAAWDRAVHAGVLPHDILQPILGFPAVTAAINLVYNLWFFVMFFCLFWQAFAARTSELRLQFLLAFAFSWFVAGNLLAVVFSSAGPCFYGRLGLAPDLYAGHMDYLHAASKVWPVWALEVQDMLWNSYATGDGLVKGISAMPSVHVTTSTVMMLLGWRVSRLAGIAFTAFFAVILIGSVHLAWHYAVDGYAGILLALLFWYAAGSLARTFGAAPR